jgi:hypothetical protein
VKEHLKKKKKISHSNKQLQNIRVNLKNRFLYKALKKHELKNDLKT